MTSTLVKRVLELAETQPEKTALAFRKEAVSYASFAEQIRKAAALIRSLNVERGARVLYTAVSKPSTFVLYLAIQYAGAVAVPTDKVGTAEHELSLYEDAGASLLITALKMPPVTDGRKVVTQKEFFARLDDAASNVFPYELPDGEELAEILFTSGTTGKPKGVMLSYRAVWNILNNTRKGVGITEDDIVLMPLPLHHSLALRCSRATLCAGGTLVLQNGFIFASETEKNQKDFRCTGFVAVPVSMELLRGQMQDRFYEIMSAFRFIEIGAGALSVEQRKRLSKNLPGTQITNTWGSSETGGVIFTYVHDVADQESRVSTLGVAIEGAELMFIDPGEEYAAGHGAPGQSAEYPGRLAIRGGMVMSGYWDRPDLTEDALRDGWLVTNDLTWRDEDGYVFMLGRSDDIINIGGEKLSPLEVENAASEYEEAGEYACIGVPDPDGILGQVPVLFAGKCTPAFSETELRKFLAARMERLKLPAKIFAVEALPRNRMEKLDRKAIAALYKTLGGSKDA